MLTTVYCFFAYVAVITHLAMIGYKISGSPEVKSMETSFGPEQQKIYNEIKVERRNHYLLGLVLGVGMAALYCLKNKCSQKQHICAFVGIATFTANMVYQLMPKKYWMVEHLDNRGDVERWNNVYKKFRMMTAYSELVGFALLTLSH